MGPLASSQLRELEEMKSDLLRKYGTVIRQQEAPFALCSRSICGKRLDQHKGGECPERNNDTFLPPLVNERTKLVNCLDLIESLLDLHV